MLFGELQRTESTPTKRMVQTLLRRYGERLHRFIEQGKARGELSVNLDNEAAACCSSAPSRAWSLRSAGRDVDRIRHDAPRCSRSIGAASGACNEAPAFAGAVRWRCWPLSFRCLHCSSMSHCAPVRWPCEGHGSDGETKSITPALFGIGTVEARHTYRIGPTFTGRVKRLDVEVGERVKSGQVLGEMEPVDLDQRIRSQEAALQARQSSLE